MTFRARDTLRTDLEKAATISHRSVSEEIEYRLQQSFQWEKAFGDIETFKVRVADMQRQTEEAERYRAGWGKRYNPNVPGGVEWFQPGTHNLPQSGLIDPNAPPPGAPTLPPVLAEAVRAEVQAAVKGLLEEAGLLGRKKKSA
jgi:hypothetical protein